MPSIHSTLTASQLARDLAVRDLTDPPEGDHAMQLLIDAAVISLAGTWSCQIRWHRGPRMVAVEDNHDRLRIPLRTRSAGTCATPATSTSAACCAATPRRCSPPPCAP
jgi:hypothetical protein